MHLIKTVSNVLLVGKLKARVSNAAAFTWSHILKAFYKCYALRQLNAVTFSLKTAKAKKNNVT